MTQETIHKMCTSSVKKFYGMIKERQPDKTKINNSTQVENTFHSLNFVILGKTDDDKPDKPEPLISLELQGSTELVGAEEKSKYFYNTDLDKFGETLIALYLEGIRSLSNINPIDRRLLEEFFKSDPVVFLKSPAIGSDEPQMPTDEERKKGKIPDENLWLWKE